MFQSRNSKCLCHTEINVYYSKQYIRAFYVCFFIINTLIVGSKNISDPFYHAVCSGFFIRFLNMTHVASISWFAELDLQYLLNVKKICGMNYNNNQDTDLHILNDIQTKTVFVSMFHNKLQVSYVICKILISNVGYFKCMN